ncbi:MAG: hypothetical protein ACNA8W_03665 [Bradymonadaceae bacterium]
MMKGFENKKYIGIGLVLDAEPDAEPDADPGAEPFHADCTVTVRPSGSADGDYETVQGALIEAGAGDVICLVDGEYAFEQELSLTVDNVEIRGQSQDGVKLDFSAQAMGSNGIYAQSVELFTIRHLTVANTPGDGGVGPWTP